MSTITTTTRNSNLNVAIAVAVTIIAVFAFAVAPSVVSPRPASIPATGSQDAYFEYLRGEKVMYANPVEASNAVESAMLDYRQGEKANYATASDLAAALTAYHLGEKEMVNIRESAWLVYLMGEKDLK